MISAFGDKKELEIEGIKHLYQCLEKGYNSMPLNFPGTPFHKSMKVTLITLTLYFLSLKSNITKENGHLT